MMMMTAPGKGNRDLEHVDVCTYHLCSMSGQRRAHLYMRTSSSVGYVKWLNLFGFVPRAGTRSFGQHGMSSVNMKLIPSNCT